MRLVILGIGAALFFSSTFILNRAMSLDGGHWLWSASLRYVYMLLLITAWLGVRHGTSYLREVWHVFREHWRFWTLAGSVGFGVFYAPLCFSAAFAPGWVIATTWEITILATPLVLLLFGKRVSAQGWLLGALIFSGIVLVNVEHALNGQDWQALWWTVLPILLAAFAYPLGLQLVWEAAQGTRHFGIPHIQSPVMHDSFARVGLLTLGSMPFWLVLTLVVWPPAPSNGQWLSTALVAVLSGFIATTLFLHARHQCQRAQEIAAVDASQSMEVVFSLVGEVWLLHAALPSLWAAVGVALTMIGLMLYAHLQS